MNTIHTASGSNVPRLRDFQEKISIFAVGTRKSKLALVQTDLVVNALTKVWPDYSYDIKARDTAAGDVDKLTPFKDMPVKNLWTHELEALMLDGKLDILVHSLKDMPTTLPPGAELGATLQREDARDVFVVRKDAQFRRIQDLPAGAVIGTSSIRRTAQIALRYPHLVVKDLRGNIDTRLAKLDAEHSPYDAIVLAAAGLLRINLADRVSQYLDSSDGGMLYAVGQGAIGIENRSDDNGVKMQLNKINHVATFLAISTERSLLRYLEGGCSAPLGVETKWMENGRLRLQAIVVSVDGKKSAEIEQISLVQSVEDAETFGVEAAKAILAMGADKILADIKAKKPTMPIDLEDK